MNQNIQIRPVSITKTVNAPQDRTFRLFVEKFSSWYPHTYTWSGNKLDTIELGTAEGDRCFERGPHHFEIDWGRILTYQPSQCIVFSWQISNSRQPVPDPEKASEVEVSFIAEGPKTKVELEHRNFEKHAEEAEKYREALASSEGWPFILECFRTFVNNEDFDDQGVFVQPIPDGYHTVTPYLVVEEADKLITFIEKAFGGEETHRTKRPDGSVMHAEIRIGDSIIMIGGGTGHNRPCSLHLYVEAVDIIYKQALEAGGQSVREPTDQFYGDRSAGVKDGWGNKWWITTHIEDISEEEMVKRQKAFQEEQ